MNSLIILLFIIVAGAVVLAIFYKKSLEIRLYSYRNVGYAAGLLALVFAFVGVLYVYLTDPSSNDKQLALQLVVSFPVAFSRLSIPILAIFNGAIIVSNISLMKHEGKKLKNCLGLFMSVAFIGTTFFLYFLRYLLRTYIFIPYNLYDNLIFAGAMTSIYIFALNMLCYVECMYVAFFIVSMAVSRIKPHHDKDYIIILGCSIAKDGCLLPLLKQRTNRAIKFAWEQEIDTGKPVHYVPSGGQGKDEIMSEGSAMEFYLLSHGAEDYEIMAEKQSRNTYENFKLSKALIDSVNPNAKVAFATTNYHLYRSGMLARRAGLDAEGIASDTKWYFWPNGLVREFIAVLNMNRKAHFYVAGVNLVWSVLIGIMVGYL